MTHCFSFLARNKNISLEAATLEIGAVCDRLSSEIDVQTKQMEFVQKQLLSQVQNGKTDVVIKQTYRKLMVNAPCIRYKNCV
jgi:hypothetical protein